MRFRLAMIIVVCLSACAQPRNDGLHHLLDEYFEDYLRENPEQATSLGRTDHDTRWRDWSGSALQAWESRLRSYQERLEDFDVADLDLQDRTSWRKSWKACRTRRGSFASTSCSGCTPPCC